MCPCNDISTSFRRVCDVYGRDFQLQTVSESKSLVTTQSYMERTRVRLPLMFLSFVLSLQSHSFCLLTVPDDNHLRLPFLFLVEIFKKNCCCCHCKILAFIFCLLQIFLHSPQWKFKNLSTLFFKNFNTALLSCSRHY